MTCSTFSVSGPECDLPPRKSSSGQSLRDVKFMHSGKMGKIAGVEMLALQCKARPK